MLLYHSKLNRDTPFDNNSLCKSNTILPVLPLLYIQLTCITFILSFITLLIYSLICLIILAGHPAKTTLDSLKDLVTIEPAAMTTLLPVIFIPPLISMS